MHGPGAGGWVQPVTKLPLPQFPTQQLPPRVLTSCLVCLSAERVGSSHWMEGKTEAQASRFTGPRSQARCRGKPPRPSLLLTGWEERGAQRGSALPGCHSEPGPAGSSPGLQATAPRLRGCFLLLLVPPPQGSKETGAVGWGRQGPCPISPDLINRPFISVLKESAIFCLLN